MIVHYTILAREVTTSADYYKSLAGGYNLANLKLSLAVGHPLEKWKSQTQPEGWVGKVI